MNARIEAEPEPLEELFHAVVAATDEAAGTRTAIDRIECFRPGRPQPTHRLEALQEV